ncbi:competence protein ComEA [Pseudarthrobacter defluvii]|uniref:ComEA family DNA-binding protein n=1 Tax=Pseudarthrobacter defluvii TaxID=410837 RepID=UPI0027869B29|nr:helix-hairpin-helix domain-containing protein [Pseudarthrobacter defluvii]MDQ0769027.1 competence protein ComEA [Pseudarthrobacter defluvii]
MSRRNAGGADQRARHSGARLQAALGEARAGLLEVGSGADGFEYRGTGESGGTETGSGRGDGSGGAPSLRWRVGLRVALLLAALAVAAGAWFWWQAGSAVPEILPLNGASSGEGTGAAGDRPAPAGTAESLPDTDRGQGEPTTGALVVVHVAGAVAKPGVIRLQSGSRVDDAIAAAGGAAADADVNRLNLALVVEDGQKIYVPQRGEPASSVPDAGGAGGPTGMGQQGSESGSAAGKINLNTADAAVLDTLPKVGPVLAQRIVDWRKEHGPFKSVEELDAVDGVGPKMLEALLPLVTV